MLDMIYIAAVDEGEAFDPVTHARHDFDAISYTLRKPGESDFWSCDVTVDNPGLGPFRPGAKRRVHISEHCSDGVVRHVFTGRIEGFPIGLKKKQVTLTFMGAPVAMTPAEVLAAGLLTDPRTQAEIDALAAINDDPWFLFHDQTEKRDSATVLAARYAALNWQRDDTAPVVVDLLEGAGLIDIGQGFISGSLSFEQMSQPISQVDVKLSAQWEQVELITDDVGNAIGPFFSNDDVANKVKIVGVGDKVGEWTIVQSGIEQLSAGAQQLFDIVEYGVPAGETTMDMDFTLTLAKNEYRPHIWAIAIGTARRTETITFSLSWGGQPVAAYNGKTDSISLECRNLTGRVHAPPHQPGTQYDMGAIVQVDGMLYQANTAHDAGATIYVDWTDWDPVLINGIDPLGGACAEWFFKAPSIITAQLPPKDVPDGWPAVTTQTVARNPDPGFSALAYAWGQARAKLLSGVRIVKASFEVPWEDVHAVTGAERIRIADSDIPGGELTGKLVSVDADLVRGTAKLTIAAAPGAANAFPGAAIPDYGTVMLGGGGIVSINVKNDFDEVFNHALSYYKPASTKVDHQTSTKSTITRPEYFSTAIDYVERTDTEIKFAMSPVPRGVDLKVDIPLGVYLIDCDRMIDLEAA